MKKIKITSKKAIRYIAAYNNSCCYNLRDCYNSWSDAKNQAFHQCRSKAYDHGYYNFKIISFNTFGFSTCAYNPQKNEYIIETPTNTLIIGG